MKKKTLLFSIVSMLLMFFHLFAYAEGEYALSNLIVRQGSETNTIYWVNSEEITELEIVDNNTGTELDLSGISTQKGAVNKVQAPTLELSSQLLEYKIICNGKTVIIQEEQIAESTATYGPFNSDGWSVGARTNLCDAGIVSDAGNKSFNLTRYENAMVWISGTASTDYESGKTYRVSFDYKGKNVTDMSLRFGGTTKAVSISDSDEWVTYTEVIQARSVSSQFMIVINGEDFVMNIDNVSVCLYEDEMVVGDNLIENGDFEDSEDTQAFSEISSAGMNGGVRFEWQETDCNGYILWTENDTVMMLHKTTTSYEVTGLEDNVEIGISIAVKGKNGVISDRLYVTAVSGMVNVPVPDKTEYQPKYFFGRNEQGTLIIIWKNPRIAPVSAALYRLTASGEEYIEANYNLSANGINTLFPGGAISDYYKLKLKFADGTTTENYATIRNVGYGQYHNWQDANTGWRKGYHLTDVNPHSGRYAYHMFRTEDKNGHLMYVGDTSSITPGKYKIGFWYRGSDYTGITVFLGVDKLVACTPSYNSWSYAEVDFDVQEASPGFRFKMNQFPDIFIDDITLHRVENGVVTGDNLIENGGFEEVSVCGPVKSYAQKEIGGKLSLSWELPDSSNCSGVNIYVNNQLIGSFFAGKNDITVGGLVSGRYNDIRIMPINAWGSPIGEAVDFRIVPKMIEYSVDELVLKKNGVRTAGLSEGSFTVETTVTNNLTEAMDATLVVAIYVQNELKQLLIDGESITDSKDLSVAPFELTKDMIENEVRVKCFVVDSLNKKLALSGVEIFE